MQIVVLDEPQDKELEEIFNYSASRYKLSYKDENDTLKYVESFLTVVLDKIKALRTLDSIRP